MNQKKTLQKTFDYQLSFVLVDILESKDVFLKFAVLNRYFYALFLKLKGYNKIWSNKFLQQFITHKDRKKYAALGPNGLDKILDFFPDHKPADKANMFEFYKDSVEKQNNLRKLIFKFLEHT